MSRRRKRARIVSVTPDVARAWLSAARPGRPLSPATVERYAQAMREGRWLPGELTLALGADGQLCDGQHRLPEKRRRA